MAKGKVKNSLLQKLKDNSTLDHTATLSESKIFTDRDMIPTSIPMLNVALSGRLAGGFTPGLTALAGPSKNFKSGFSLVFLAAYFKKYADAVCLYYDSEFGTPKTYFDSFGIDKDKVVHSPITDIEQLKHDIMTQLTEIGRNEHVIIIVDSIGNLASRKEIDDAVEGKSVADMTRAKQLKSLFRMVTSHLVLKNIPMIIINHTYKEIGLFPKDIMGGGTGPMYSSDTVWILGRQQEKDSTGVTGYNFVINVDKSRFVKEKSKILIEVDFNNGISPWSGLLDAAVKSGHVQKITDKKYQRVDTSTGELVGEQLSETKMNTAAFWTPILTDKTFSKYIEDTYKLAGHDLVEVDNGDDEDDSV